MIEIVAVIWGLVSTVFSGVLTLFWAQDGRFAAEYNGYAKRLRSSFISVQQDLKNGELLALLAISNHYDKQRQLMGEIEEYLLGKQRDKVRELWPTYCSRVDALEGTGNSKVIYVLLTEIDLLLSEMTVELKPR